MRMIAIHAQTERKRLDRSVRCAEKRRPWARKQRLRGLIRPDPAVCATAGAACGRKSLSSARIQAIFTSNDTPLGECRTNYLEVYHRDNVKAVSLRDNGIAQIVPEGVKLEDGTLYPLDVIIMAVGFDAGSGALSRIDIRGRDGVSLREEWAKDIRTTLGLMKHGFPNLFMTGAPLAPSAALCNMTTCLQQQTEWISDCIKYLESTHQSVIEPTSEGEAAWVEHHDETANANLISRTNSWYTGSNVPGKPRRVLSYTGGVGTYRAKCSEVAANGYAGFALGRSNAEQAG